MNENNPNQFGDVLAGKTDFVEDEGPFWRRQSKWPLNRAELVALGIGAGVVVVFVGSVAWRLLT